MSNDLTHSIFNLKSTISFTETVSNNSNYTSNLNLLERSNYHSLSQKILILTIFLESMILIFFIFIAILILLSKKLQNHTEAPSHSEDSSTTSDEIPLHMFIL